MSEVSDLYACVCMCVLRDTIQFFVRQVMLSKIFKILVLGKFFVTFVTLVVGLFVFRDIYLIRSYLVGPSDRRPPLRGTLTLLRYGNQRATSGGYP